MRSLVIYGQETVSNISTIDKINTLEIENIKVKCGLLHTKKIEFEPDLSTNSDFVLIKIKAFSCNYRDKSLILRASKLAKKNQYYVIGSEFVAEVVAAGKNVSRFQPGDRVIGDGCYPDTGVENVAPGLPSNHGSREYQIVHERKLISIPNNMPDQIAAVFSIGGQTTYSMLRKTQVQKGDSVLVTSANSNTSLFMINVLNNMGVKVFVTTTSPKFKDKLLSMGVEKVFVLSPSIKNFMQDWQFKDTANQLEGFDIVVDPYFDLHLGRVIDAIAVGGRYITCGFADQYSNFTGQNIPFIQESMTSIMTKVMIKNITLIGNCVGSTQDLQQALDDYSRGKLKVIADSIFRDGQESTFLNRTYNDQKRFGKVVFNYK